MGYPNSWNVLSSMRQMAWERAKGELRSMYVTDWVADDSDDGRRQKARREAFEKFIKEVEWLGLQE